MSPSTGSEQARCGEQARLSINLPKNLYKRLKLHAHDKDSTLSALIIQLIKDEIGRSTAGESSSPCSRP